MPRVSVIVPCFNAAPYIDQTVTSVAAQSLSDWELTAVDDGSTDSSADVLAGWTERDPRVKLVRQLNRGVAAARNAGFAHSNANAEHLLFLDADDCLEPSMLEVMTRYLEARPEVGMAYCAHTLIDGQGRRLDPREVPWAPRWVPSDRWMRKLTDEEPETPFVSVFCLAGIVPSMALIRRSVYRLTPGWDERFGQHYEDTNLFLQIALVSKIHYVPEPLVRHRRHPIQSTADIGKFAAQERKLYELWREPQGLTEAQHETVRSAWRFRERRLIPAQAWAAVGRNVRRGRPLRALRFLAGMLRIASMSYLRGVRR
jgi:glycosyltransferase involved in cell wall biosynthesis